MNGVWLVNYRCYEKKTEIRFDLPTDKHDLKRRDRLAKELTRCTRLNIPHIIVKVRALKIIRSRAAVSNHSVAVPVGAQEMRPRRKLCA